MTKREGNSGNSILDGLESVIDEKLGLKARHRYKHPKSYLILSEEPVSNLDGKALIKAIYDKVESNWNKASYHNPSKENWRFEPRTDIDENNEDPEIRLERAIVKSLASIRDDVVWANQVPTASGFVAPHADGHRNIDLVHRCEDDSYEFVELKWESNTPLFAAMEILQYGVLYIFSRLKREIRDAAAEKRLLDAPAIHLRVLAPFSYYRRGELAWLERAISVGLREFLTERRCGFQMDFQFQAFPRDFRLDRPFRLDPDIIARALVDRFPVNR